MLVGGAVRDALLGRPLHDLDWLVPDPEAAARSDAAALAGSAFPLDLGRGHWRVVATGLTRDYAPDLGDLAADLAARDFTINAMALTPNGNLVDPHGGLADLRSKRLRMVQRANLAADPLRLFRATRLAATLRFRIENGTHKALQDLAAALIAGGLPMPAWERIRAELEAIIGSEQAAGGFQLLAKLGLLEPALPELEANRGVAQGGFHHLDVLDHSLEALNQLLHGFPEADPGLRWATLLHDIGKAPAASLGEDGRRRFYGHDRLGAALAEAALGRLHYPHERIDRVRALVGSHMVPLPKTDKEARRFAHRRRVLLPDLLKLMIADREAARGRLSSDANRRAYRVALARILAILAETPPKPPLLDGHDVMILLGLEPGARVGEALRFIAEAEAMGDVATRKEAQQALERFADARGWNDAT